ncbi:MAG TPA: uridine kinase [Bryobacteraceae bacterium]|nr:uridine kinase [Bryobacteraceae bacterium]
MQPFLIGVAGLSGSGKTAFASRLAEAFSPAAQILSLDSYYLPQSHLSFDQRTQQNYDHPDALDWNLLLHHLASLSRGESIDQPCYLFDLHTRGPETRRLEPSPILILEGILALSHPAVRQLLDLKVFISTDSCECFRRRLTRDILERGRTRESVLAQWESTVWPMAVEFVLPSRDFADVVVSGEQPFDAAVDRVRKLASAIPARAARA